jgi:hypothetical protein
MSPFREKLDSPQVTSPPVDHCRARIIPGGHRRWPQLPDDRAPAEPREFQSRTLRRRLADVPDYASVGQHEDLQLTLCVRDHSGRTGDQLSFGAKWTNHVGFQDPPQTSCSRRHSSGRPFCPVLLANRIKRPPAPAVTVDVLIIPPGGRPSDVRPDHPFDQLVCSI